jgi:hypothetical protein
MAANGDLKNPYADREDRGNVAVLVFMPSGTSTLTSANDLLSDGSPFFAGSQFINSITMKRETWNL